MDNNIYNIEDYYRLLELQRQYEEGLIDEDELSLMEINRLIKLYKSQIIKIENNIKYKMLYKGMRDNKWEKKFMIF